MPCGYEIGSTTITNNSIITVENYYRIIYFEAFDIVIAQITDQFEQEGYQMYSKLEKLLIGKLDNDLDELIEFYGNDFEKDVLLAQHDRCHVTVHDIIPVIKTMSCAEKLLFKEVVQLISMILVLPATNAVSERSFSTMRRMKNYLRTSMTQQIFHSIMTLHININSLALAHWHLSLSFQCAAPPPFPLL